MLNKENKEHAVKVNQNSYGVYFCNNCGGSVWQIKHESNYCFRCGCKLDWRKANAKS